MRSAPRRFKGLHETYGPDAIGRIELTDREHLYQSDVPKHCHDCGAPYPWIQRRIETAAEWLREEQVSEEVIAAFSENMLDLTSTKSRAELAAAKIGKLLKNVAPAAKDAVYKIAAEIIVKGAAKALTGQ